MAAMAIPASDMSTLVGDTKSANSNSSPLPLASNSNDIQSAEDAGRRFTYTSRESMASPATDRPSITSSAQLNQSTLLDQMLPQSAPTKKKPNDFLFLKIIGEGSFATVYLGREVNTNNDYAIKVCNKVQIKRERKIPYVMREKEVMALLSVGENRAKCPFFVRLYCTFQDEQYLYYVMTLGKRGELQFYMTRLGSFDDKVSQFYAAEILLALDFLHSIGVIHRDLKPENILLGVDWHILISDFGSAKIIGREDDAVLDRPTPLVPLATSPSKKRSSFVGTAQYVSPEVLAGKPISVSCDYWALGCVIYQMLSGLPPFRAATEYLIFKKIQDLQFTFPDGFPQIPKDLVKHLLKVNPDERYGSPALGGIMTLKSHPFFDGINFSTLATTTPPRLVPYVPGSGDEPPHHSRFHPSLDEALLSANVKPGFDENQLARLVGLEIGTSEQSQPSPPSTGSPAAEARLARLAPATAGVAVGSANALKRPIAILDMTEEERKNLKRIQMKDNPYDRFVDGNLILKSGMIDKKKGLFARKRMFLLTDGPHLYYVDPQAMELRGQIPWSKHLRTEAKNFRTFFIHTPNRVYFLFDHNSHAQEWCDAVNQVRDYYFPSNGSTSAAASAACSKKPK